MGILERSKVKLSLTLDQDTYLPGDELTGNVHMDVKEAVSFRALRLRVRGRETTDVLIQRGTATMSVTDEADYTNSWMTFTGPSKRSQSREKQTYEPGCYRYPFRMPLSPHLPPTFVVTTSSGRVSLQYTASVVLDIPNGFDATDEVVFRLLSIVPLHQFTVRAGRDAAIPSTRIARVFKHDWACCLWGERGDAVVHVSASITPAILALHLPSTDLGERVSTTTTTIPVHERAVAAEGQEENPAQSPPGHGPRHSDAATPATCEVTVKLFNDSDEPLPALRLELLNIVRLQYDVHESYHCPVVAKAALEHLDLAPQQERTVTVPLTLSVPGFRTCMEDPAKLPIPSLVTPVVRSTYSLKVKFPGSKIERETSFMGLADIVDTVSPLAGVMGVPRRFLPLAGLGTEVRYVAQPTMVTFPSEDELVYPSVHEPYLPRAEKATSGGSAGSNEPTRTTPMWNETAREHRTAGRRVDGVSDALSDVSRATRSGSSTDTRSVAPIPCSPQSSADGEGDMVVERHGDAAAGGEEEGGGRAVRQRNPNPSTPVLARPVPGHIVQGSVSHLPAPHHCKGR